MRRLAFSGLAVLAAAGLALAEGTPGRSTRTRPTLHEDMPGPDSQPTPMIGATQPGKSPAAFTAGDKVVPKPPLDAPAPADAKKDEPVLGKGGFGADRQTAMRPDNATGPDATLHYVSVFNPDVLPFKRMSALDTAGDDYVLHIGRTALQELPVGGATDKSRDRFWGSVLVELRPGAEVPLPSVAPDMRILSYDIAPSVRLHFEKDGADNFYVRSDEPSATGTYRLIFLADADAGYFAPGLPTGARYTARTVQSIAPTELRPRLPPAIQKAAKRTLDKIGIDADMELSVAFNKLVAYFRAFSAKPLPPSSGDLYRDLVDSQAGVCRHRAFAFMITANALGLPTRFVSNEAHAFVEVWFPERKWQRIDLGGAALRMEVTGADNKTLHRPRTDDPFAKPSEYSKNYTQLEGDIKGLSSQQLADKHKSLDQSPPSGAFDAKGAGSGAGSGAPAPDRITPDPTLPAVTQDPKKQTPVLTVTTADAQAYRGGQIHVEGHAGVAGRGVKDHSISVFLSPAGEGGAHAKFLGTTVTGADGTFREDFAIPAGVNLATYEIWLSSAEDAYFNAALSEQ